MFQFFATYTIAAKKLFRGVNFSLSFPAQSHNVTGLGVVLFARNIIAKTTQRYCLELVEDVAS